MKKPYSLLHSAIVANGATCASVAKEIGISSAAMSQKMQAHSFFTIEEIAAIGKLLDIPACDYYTYFVQPIVRLKGA